ncbi:MAG: PorT family protein [Bacteroidetes bacterium]|nr:MAG: PorT family protein [Bacteroidota bacterium]
MNTRFVALIFSFLLFCSVQAQHELGVKMGPSIMGFYGSQAYATQSTGAVSAGALYRYRINEGMAFQMEVNYVQSGQIALRRNYPNVRYMELNYFQIPLLLHLRTKSGSIKPGIFTGPYLSSLASHAYSPLYYNIESSAYSLDQVNPSKLDLGWILGFGVDYDLGPLFLMADLRYNLGLKNLDNGNPGRTSNDLKQAGIQMNLGAGIRF